MKSIIVTLVLALSALIPGTGVAHAQTLTGRYVELADSADFYMKHQRWDDAERTIISALRHEPANKSNWLLWSNLGVVRTHMEKYAPALEAYDIGLSGAPHSTVLHNNRAWTLLAMGKGKEALADLDESLATDSLQVWPLKMRGLLRVGTDTSRARRDLEKADSLGGADADVLASLADIDAAEGNTKSALDRYRRSFDLQPDPDVAFRRLLVMTEKGNYTEAQTLTIDALRRWTQHPALHLLRALQHQRNFETDAAEHEKNLALMYGADPLLIDQILNRKSSGKGVK